MDETVTSTSDLAQELERFREEWRKVRAEVGKVIVGQGRVVDCTLTAILGGGNVLLEGVPGLGKTELVKTLARVLDLDYRRIQFTPDLMPADILGTYVLHADPAGAPRFQFRKGPIFTQLLLADEINRASPKTQSALLETMQEATVTIGGETHRLELPFFVLATQNPIEQEGTYPLPEAQLDRFLFKVSVPFLDRDELNEVVNRTILQAEVEVQKVLSGARILELRRSLDKVVVAPPMRDFAVRMVLATHPDSALATPKVKQYVRWGASPRSAQALVRAGRVRALTEGRAHLAFEDVRFFAPEVLQHRIILNYDGQAEDVKIGELIQEVVQSSSEQG